MKNAHEIDFYFIQIIVLHHKWLIPVRLWINVELNHSRVTCPDSRLFYTSYHAIRLQIIFIATAVAFQPARIYVICASECYVRPTYPFLFEGGFHITSFMSAIKPPRIPSTICLSLSLSLSLTLSLSHTLCFPRWLVG